MEGKTIPLTRGMVALVDEDDYEAVSQFKWYAKPSKYTWYAARSDYIPGTKTPATIRMHRFILGLGEGGPKVDHASRDGLDNRRSNIRVATNSQNGTNSKLRPNNKSGYRGVYFDGRYWRAGIRCGEIALGLGLFPTAEDAARAYDRKAIELHGDFATLNSPTDTDEIRLVSLKTRLAINNTSGLKGVSKTDSGKWKAVIQHKGVMIYLGRFNSSCEAAVAYDQKAVELWGEHARLNYPVTPKLDEILREMGHIT